MKRGTILGAAGGLVAGVSLATLALASPSWSLGPSSSAAASLAAPLAGQLAAPVAAQQARWGAVANLADLVERVSPSVVKIDVRSSAPQRTQSRQFGGGGGDNPFEGTPFERFFGPGGQGQGEQRDARGSGSGFLIQGGYVVTNNHVVDNAKKMTVEFSDGRQVNATLVGTDEKTDLAVIKIDGGSLPPALQWGDSKRARPGDNVFAVGAPFGLSNTVTSGIVSARGRSLSGSYDDYIQVDAAINMGNSGGPLFDQNGNVIGVNSAIISPSGANAGIGFSIPSDLAQNVVSQLISHGSVERGWLGVEIGQITPEIASALNVPTKGVLVNSVTPNSPASKAGVKDQDVIVAFGNREIAHMTDLTRAVADTKAGTTQDLRVVRNGRAQTIKVRIEALKAEKDVASLEPDDAVASPTSAAGQLALSELGISLAANDEGIFVTNVKVNSPAEDAFIEKGDRIVMVNQVEVKSTDAVRKAVEEAKKQKRSAVMLQVENNGRKRFVGVPFSEG